MRKQLFYFFSLVTVLYTVRTEADECAVFVHALQDTTIIKNDIQYVHDVEDVMCNDVAKDQASSTDWNLVYGAFNFSGDQNSSESWRQNYCRTRKTHTSYSDRTIKLVKTASPIIAEALNRCLIQKNRAGLSLVLLDSDAVKGKFTLAVQYGGSKYDPETIKVSIKTDPELSCENVPQSANKFTDRAFTCHGKPDGSTYFVQINGPDGTKMGIQSIRLPTEVACNSKVEELSSPETSVHVDNSRLSIPAGRCPRSITAVVRVEATYETPGDPWWRLRIAASSGESFDTGEVGFPSTGTSVSVRTFTFRLPANTPGEVAVKVDNWRVRQDHITISAKVPMP